MKKQTYKSAKSCETMLDVRQAIDSLDEELLDLLKLRLSYIERAAQIKTSATSIRDVQRINSIIAKRKSQALDHGYSEEFIEKLFYELIEYSINHEMKLWNTLNKNTN